MCEMLMSHDKYYVVTCHTQLGQLGFKIHCNLVITLILGAKRNGSYNKTSVIMKCTF